MLKRAFQTLCSTAFRHCRAVDVFPRADYLTAAVPVKVKAARLPKEMSDGTGDDTAAAVRPMRVRAACSDGCCAVASAEHRFQI